MGEKWNRQKGGGNLGVDGTIVANPHFDFFRLFVFLAQNLC
jgi:hypothetical protein